MIQAGSGACIFSSGDSDFTDPAVSGTGAHPGVRRRTSGRWPRTHSRKPAAGRSNHRNEPAPETSGRNDRCAGGKQPEPDLGGRRICRNRSPRRTPGSLSGTSTCRSGKPRAEAQRAHGFVQRRALHAGPRLYRGPDPRQPSRPPRPPLMAPEEA